MSDESQVPPEAVVEEKSRISVVWIVPIVAVLIGAYLSYQAIMDRGPTITIHFETGEGLAAGKTQVKFKEIEIGTVSSVDLDDDLEHVIVTAELTPGAGKYLTENTRFWVVRATVRAGQVSGLGTLFSGAYIGMEPSTEGKRARKFVGLETAPVVTRDQPGRHFFLRSDKLGSFNLGAPVYYRSIDVGQVVAFDLDEAGKYVTVEVFVRAPHHKRIRQNTRFWDASGFDVTLSAEGVKIDTPSMVAILIGGVGFDTAPGIDAGNAPAEGHVFYLYANRQASSEEKYTDRVYYLAHFKGSVQGLTPGSPVIFRGIKIGEVVDLKLTYHPDTVEFEIPVLIELQPGRINVGESELARLAATAPQERPIVSLVRRGLRAQLGMGNLLTGALQVELDMFPDAEPAEMDFSGEHPAIPTVDTPLDKLTAGLGRVIEKLEDLPLEQMGDELNKSLKSLSSAMREADSLLDPDGPTRRELTRAITELAQAARSARLLADYLEQHPEALVRGKEQ